MIPYADTVLPSAPVPAPAEPASRATTRSSGPFMLTGGRTQPLHDGLRIETLLHAAPAALSAPLRFESRRIVELCQAPTSIADLAVGAAGAARRRPGHRRRPGRPSGYVRIEEQLDELPIALIERIRDRVRAL